MRYSFLIFLLLCFSCGDNKQSTQGSKKKNYNKSLNLIDSLDIEIDNYMAYRYVSHQVVETDSTTLLLVGELNNNGFAILDIEKEQLLKKITFEVTGPNGIGTNSGGRYFYYHNNDSIFLFSGRQKKIFISNLNGVLKSNYDLNNITGLIGQPIVGSRRPLLKHSVDNTISFVLYPSSASLETGLKNSINDPVIGKLDLDNASLIKYNIKYEENSRNIHYEFFLPLIAYSGNDVNLLFPLSKSIYIFKDGKENEFLHKEFESDYVSHFEPLIKGGKSIFNKFYLESSFNSILYFDKKAHLFYLIIEIGIPFIDPTTGRQNQTEQKPFSVLVFDKDFNKLTEQWFEGGKYLIQNTFVGPKGFYLSKNNPLNPDFDENYYSYDIYRVEEN